MSEFWYSLAMLLCGVGLLAVAVWGGNTSRARRVTVVLLGIAMLGLAVANGVAIDGDFAAVQARNRALQVKIDSTRVELKALQEGVADPAVRADPRRQEDLVQRLAIVQRNLDAMQLELDANRKALAERRW
jgi:hypothetical protein